MKVLSILSTRSSCIEGCCAIWPSAVQDVVEFRCGPKEEEVKLSPYPATLNLQARSINKTIAEANFQPG